MGIHTAEYNQRGPQHPCSEAGMETGYDDEGWDEGLEGSLEQVRISFAPCEEDH